MALLGFILFSPTYGVTVVIDVLVGWDEQRDAQQG
jgi:hypothetical protein